MDVPELTDDLIDKIASQSDAQSGAYSIRELEAIRDRNLVAFMRSLKSHNWAAGAFLNEVEAASQPESPQIDDIDISQPLVLHQGRVMPEWIDYNGHMTEYRYGNVFSDATDAVLRLVGLDDAYLARGYSYYTVETHIRHLGEAHKGDAFTVQSQLIKADGKKLHLCHQMMNDAGMVLATGEHLLLHVDTNKGASCVPEEPLFPQLTKLAAAQEALPLPDFCGRAVGKK